MYNASDGRFLRSVGSPSPSPSPSGAHAHAHAHARAREGHDRTQELCQPDGVCLSGDGELFVADSRHGRVAVFRAADGLYLRSVGAKGSGPGEFSNPCGVCLSRAGELYVADLDNHRVAVFRASDGQYLRAASVNQEISSEGAGAGACVTVKPFQLCVSAAGEVFVTADNLSHVQVFLSPPSQSSPRTPRGSPRSPLAALSLPGSPA